MESFNGRLRDERLNVHQFRVRVGGHQRECGGRWDSSIPEPLRASVTWRDPHVADAMIERVLALDPTNELISLRFFNDFM